MALRLGLIALSVVLIVKTITGEVTFQLDFNGDLYIAGHRILNGVSPYQPGVLATQATIVGHGGVLGAGASPRYPAPWLVTLAPLTLLPVWWADVSFALVSALAVILALRLLGVRDWRCLVLACISWPVVFGVWLGNMSPLLLLGCAAVWRWRSRLWPPAAAVASIVVAKLFLWPLGVWLLARRLRSAVLAVAVILVVTITAWAVIGFADFTAYPRMLFDVASISEGRGCSLVATMMSLGVAAGPARALALACGIALMVAAWRLSQLPDGERRAFGLTVVAALIASPVAWAHYLLLLFVPVALLSPELSGIWFLPMLAGLEPGPVAHPHVWISLPAVAIEFVIAVRLCSPLCDRWGERIRLPVTRVLRRTWRCDAPAALG